MPWRMTSRFAPGDWDSPSFRCFICEAPIAEGDPCIERHESRSEWIDEDNEEGSGAIFFCPRDPCRTWSRRAVTFEEIIDAWLAAANARRLDEMVARLRAERHRTIDGSRVLVRSQQTIARAWSWGLSLDAIVGATGLTVPDVAMCVASGSSAIGLACDLRDRLGWDQETWSRNLRRMDRGEREPFAELVIAAEACVPDSAEPAAQATKARACTITGGAVRS